MSDGYSGSDFSGIVNVKIGESAARELDRAAKLLAGIPGGIEKAAGAALTRAAVSGRASAAREVNKQYTLKTADFKKYTKSYQHIQRSVGEISVSIEFRGYHIPLIRFNSRVGQNGLYTVNVKRDNVGQTFKHVFRAEMKSGYIGLFERYGKGSLPIEQKMGPSVPQMMSANEKLPDAVGEQVRRTFEDRMEHEIMAVMNGWHG